MLFPLMPQLEEMERRLSAIEARNARVEADKAWEISLARRLVIAIGTYIVVLIFLLLIGTREPYLAALVPALGFLLSTLTLPFLKRMWERNRV